MNFKLIAQFGLVTLLATSLNACGTATWSHRDTNPSIQDQVYSSNIFQNLFSSTRAANAFATTASRRIVIVSEDTRRKGELITCSEPPPDVGEAFGSAITDQLKIAASDPHSGITAALANPYARAVATHIAPLLYRSQG